jgi:hypothetical protein
MVLKTSAHFAVIAAVLLSACSPANRISRILARHPDLKAVSQVDTIYQDGSIVFDTSYITKTDTFSSNDTTYIRKTDTIRLAGRCPKSIRETKTVYLPVGKGKDSTKGRERKVRKESQIREPRMGFFERVERFMANGVLLMVLVVGYALGAFVNEILNRRKNA